MKTIRLCLTASLPLLALLSIPARAAVSDAEIAAIVVTANQVDIDAGKLAAERAADAATKAFASTMVTDHSAVNALAVELAGKLKLTPRDNETSRALKKAGDENLTRLRGLSGKAFDQAYIEHEVAYHDQVIQALDTLLIPNAQNAELKALLVKVRPAFVAHLEHARNLQSGRH